SAVMERLKEAIQEGAIPPDDGGLTEETASPAPPATEPAGYETVDVEYWTRCMRNADHHRAQAAMHLAAFGRRSPEQLVEERRLWSLRLAAARAHSHLAQAIAGAPTVVEQAEPAGYIYSSSGDALSDPHGHDFHDDPNGDRCVLCHPSLVGPDRAPPLDLAGLLRSARERLSTAQVALGSDRSSRGILAEALHAIETVWEAADLDGAPVTVDDVVW